MRGRSICCGNAVDYEIVGLLTTPNTEVDRVAMHGTGRSGLEAQARDRKMADLTVGWVSMEMLDCNTIKNTDGGETQPWKTPSTSSADLPD